MEPYRPNCYKIPELNGLRVLLVFIVSWYHFWQQSWLTPSIGSYSLDYLLRAGYMPVDGTILLSGFLLFLPYARAMLLAVAGILLTLPFAARPLRFLMGNRVMGWLAAVSMNYYLLHQNLAVHLKRLGVPPSVSAEPNRAGEQPWQLQYTLLCFGLSLLGAALITLLIEKPCAKVLKKMFARGKAENKA